MTSRAPSGPSTRKDEVRAFWDVAACGEVYAEGADDRERFDRQRATRYALEPFIAPFARFGEVGGLEVLEIGVGMGADHLEFAAAGPRRLVGLDLTARAVATTAERAALEGTAASLFVGDAEALALRTDAFDVVFSWGVLHHSPDTEAAVREVRRVLRPTGVARVMVYQRRSIVGALLWARYALAKGRPRTPLAEVYAHHLESPGTKTYTSHEVEALFRRAGFHHVTTRIELSGGDLLEGAAGQRHDGAVLRTARRIWPRRLIRRFGGAAGLFLLVEAR